MKSGDAVFREAVELWGNEGEPAVRKLLWDHFEEVLHQKVMGQLPDWKILLQDAVELAAREDISENELDGQLNDEVAKFYVNNGDLENPDLDGVYDMIKDKEMGL